MTEPNERTMTTSNDTTQNLAVRNPSAANRWLAGLAVGAVGVGGLAGVDEAYGAIITLDNGGTGWSLNKPAFFPGSTSAATVSADIGSPGQASFKLGWYNDSIGSTAFVSGVDIDSGDIRRNVASQTPGDDFFYGRMGVRTPYGSFSNGAQTGSDNWLAISITDAAINGGTTSTGWMQLDFASTTHTIQRIMYSDAGGILHLDGAGGMTEDVTIPEPTTLALLAAGAGGIVVLRRRRKVPKPLAAA